MAILYVHGIHDDYFQHRYGTAPTVNSWVASRHGAGAYNVPDVTGNVAQLVTLDTGQAEVYAGIAVSSANNRSEEIFYIYDTNGSRICLVRLDNDGTVYVFNDVSNNDYTSPPGVILWDGTWNVITLRVVVSDTAGVLSVQVGDTVVLEETGINTGTVSVGQVGWHARFSDPWVVEDFWIASESHHDARIASLRPDADGFHQDWTRSNTGVAAYTLVNDVPGDETSYVSSDVASQRSTFSLDAVPSDSQRPNIGAVVPWAAVDKSDATARSCAVSVRESSTDYDGTAQAIGGQSLVFHVWEQNPSTAVAWTAAEVDAAEAGVVSS